MPYAVVRDDRGRVVDSFRIGLDKNWYDMSEEERNETLEAVQRIGRKRAMERGEAWNDATVDSYRWQLEYGVD